jgi:O-antigen/teichoic acid export membrane protein
MHSRAAVAANFGSFAVLGVSGVATNVVLSYSYGSELLGAFNQILSLYIIGAQLAAGGTHLAVTRLLPLHTDDAFRQWSTVVAALVLAGALSIGVALAVLAGRPLLMAVFGSPLVALGLPPLIAALALCGINKVMLGVLNATERHAAFASVQALRPLIVLIGVVLMWRLGLDGASVFALVPLSELVVLALSVVLVLPLGRSAGWRSAWRREISPVRRFSTRVFPGSLVAEANSRIDVLVLGALASDRLVGIYSFASMYAEGLAQLPSVIRNSVNARMARLSGDPLALWQSLPGLMRFAYLFLVPMFLLGAGVYYFIVLWTLPPAEHQQAFIVFAIVVSCLIVVAGALPLDMLLSQLGFPGTLSVLRGVLFVANLGGCIVLYHWMGIYGVAASVGLTFIAFSIGTLLAARHVTRRHEQQIAQ